MILRIKSKNHSTTKWKVPTRRTLARMSNGILELIHAAHVVYPIVMKRICQTGQSSCLTMVWRLLLDNRKLLIQVWVPRIWVHAIKTRLLTPKRLKHLQKLQRNCKVVVLGFSKAILKILKLNNLTFLLKMSFKKSMTVRKNKIFLESLSNSPRIWIAWTQGILIKFIWQNKKLRKKISPKKLWTMTWNLMNKIW